MLTKKQLSSFLSTCLQDKDSVHKVSVEIDKASGYIMSQNERDALTAGLLYPAEYQYTK